MSIEFIFLEKPLSRLFQKYERHKSVLCIEFNGEYFWFLRILKMHETDNRQWKENLALSIRFTGEKEQWLRGSGLGRHRDHYLKKGFKS